MTTEDFITFQKYNSLEEAQELVSILEENGLKVQIEDASPPIDITFSGNTFNNEIRIKIKQSDFETANSILEKIAEQNTDEIQSDHYLYDFSDEELIEILEKPDEWSKEDHILSQKILNERGTQISKEKVEELRAKRIEELRKPEKGNIGWIIFGFISSLCGGLIGIFIGWFLWSFKKTDPTGHRIYAYDKSTRKVGQIIFWLGLVIFITYIIVWIGKQKP